MVFKLESAELRTKSRTEKVILYPCLRQQQVNAFARQAHYLGNFPSRMPTRIDQVQQRPLLDGQRPSEDHAGS